MYSIRKKETAYSRSLIKYTDSCGMWSPLFCVCGFGMCL